METEEMAKSDVGEGSERDQIVVVAVNNRRKRIEAGIVNPFRLLPW